MRATTFLNLVLPMLLPAAALGQSARLLPSGAEVCLNGVRITGKADGTGDSGLVVDNVACTSLYIHATGFETGDFLEWSAVSGAAP